MSPSGFFLGLVTVVGLGQLLTFARSLADQNEVGRNGDSKGGTPMRRRLAVLLGAMLESIWSAAANTLQAPKG